MISEVEKRKNRAVEISKSLMETGKVEAMIGFGSLAELDRLDQYSDLDFLAIPQKEHLDDIIENLEWIERVAPILLKCKFTKDGYKVLFEDGILCDFGILTSDETKMIPHDEGRVIWSMADFDLSVKDATYRCNHQNLSKSECDNYYERALIDIIVGLSRLKRGEIFSATKVIQEEALEKVLIAISNQHTSNAVNPDPFQVSRRFEKIYPQYTHILEEVLLGYEGNIEAISFLIKIISANYDIDDKLNNHIKGLMDVGRDTGM